MVTVVVVPTPRGYAGGHRVLGETRCPLTRGSGSRNTPPQARHGAPPRVPAGDPSPHGGSRQIPEAHRWVSCPPRPPPQPPPCSPRRALGGPWCGDGGHRVHGGGGEPGKGLSLACTGRGGHRGREVAWAGVTVPPSRGDGPSGQGRRTWSGASSPRCWRWWQRGTSRGTGQGAGGGCQPGGHPTSGQTSRCGAASWCKPPPAAGRMACPAPAPSKVSLGWLGVSPPPSPGLEHPHPTGCQGWDGGHCCGASGVG